MPSTNTGLWYLRRDVSLILAPQQRIDGSRRRPLGDVDKFFNPNESGCLVGLVFAANGDCDHAALIVRAVVADTFPL